MVAAVIGGGLRAFGLEIPIFSSAPRQGILFLVGGALLALGMSSGHDPRIEGPVISSNSSGGGGKTQNSNEPAGATSPKAPKPAVMGQLLIQTNLQGNDFDAYGKPAENAELCAEMCRTDAQCDAMTYVISRKTCWLKSGIPPALSNPDMISSIKHRSDN